MLQYSKDNPYKTFPQEVLNFKIIGKTKKFLKEYPKKLSFAYFLKDNLPHQASFIKKALFNKVELFEIVNDALKFIINLSPWRLFDILKDGNEFGLFENLEALEGQSKCDYSIGNASTLKKTLKNEETLVHNDSIFDEFMLCV